jgi:hypothetical protein
MNLSRKSQKTKHREKLDESDTKMMRIHVIQKEFRPNLSRRSVATMVNSTVYDQDDANSREQQANPSQRDKLLERF